MAADKTERSGWVTLNRVSSTIRKIDKEPNSKNFEKAEAPCLKKGGGVRSSVPKGIVETGQ
jgi:hypothetical protein